jgi:RimJ/RimL family protein N-acetyltransferase
VTTHTESRGATFLFYVRARSRPLAEQSSKGSEQVRVWRPSWTRIPPRPLRSLANWLWWLFHILRVFRTREFAVLFIEHEGRLVHRTVIFPPFFRFPFMRPEDLQIGDTWTEESARGQGIAGSAVRAALTLVGPSPGRVWYVVEAGNGASIRVVEKASFRLSGLGGRCSRLGLRLLGYYAITEPVDDGPPASV